MHIRRRFVFVGAFLALVLAIGGILIFELIRHQEAEQAKSNAERLRHHLLINLEFFFREHFDALTLASAMYRDGVIRSQADFNYHARQIFSMHPGFRTIAITSDDYTLAFKYPFINLYHDLKKYPDRFPFAEKAKRTRSLAVTNPVHMVPDGRLGFGAYAPVFEGERFKGLVVGTFDINHLVDKRLKPIFGGIPFSISTRQGQVFYRADEKQVDLEDDLILPVRLGDNIWNLRAPRIQEPANISVYDRVILMVALVLVATVFFTLLYLFQTHKLEIQQQALRIFEDNYRDISRKFETKLEENVTLCDELRKAQGDLIRATRLAALGEMSTVIAHEIRNPLSALVNCIGMLKRTLTVEGEDARLLDLSMKEVFRLNQIVSDFLAYSRPRRLALQRVHMADLLDEVRWGFMKDDRWKGLVTVKRECRTACPVIDVDPNLMRQVFWNLLTNAAQAMDLGGEIRLQCGMTNGHAEVSVHDAGQGIPSEVQPRVFEPFFTTKGLGMGLGLAIVKRIIEDHGGQISIASEKGAGTVVQIHLPLKVEEEVDVTTARSG